MPTTKRGYNVVVWITLFTVITTILLVGRFWASTIQRRSFRLDDFLVVFDFLCLLALEIPVLISYNHNLGAHTTDLTQDQKALLLKIQLSAGITWTLATCSCKIAVLWMYLNIFPPGNVRYTVYAGIVLSIACAVTFIPIFMSSCNPPSASWSPDIHVTIAKCKPIQRQEFSSVAVNMVLDFAVVLIPLPSIWKLKLRTSKKVFVSLMFSCGLLIVGVMCWRIQTTVESTKTQDWSYIYTTTVLQSHLEIWLGIIAANLPMMSPLLTKLVMPSITKLVSSLSSFRNTTKVTEGRSSGSGGERTFANGRKEFQQLKDENGSMEIPLIVLGNRDIYDGISAGQTHHSHLPKGAIRRDTEIYVTSSQSTRSQTQNDFRTD